MRNGGALSLPGREGYAHVVQTRSIRSGLSRAISSQKCILQAAFSAVRTKRSRCDPLASAGIFLKQAAKTHFSRRCLQAQNGIGDHLAHHRTLLKAVAGAAANDPDIFRFGVVIQNVIVVCGVLILAYPALNQRSAGHRWKAQAKIGSCSCQSLIRDVALHGGGVNNRSARVVRHLEAAPVVSRNAIELVLATVNPGRQLRVGEAQVACSSAEEEDLLTSGSDNRL